MSADIRVFECAGVHVADARRTAADSLVRRGDIFGLCGSRNKARSGYFRMAFM